MKIRLKFTCLKFHSNLPVVNELMQNWHDADGLAQVCGISWANAMDLCHGKQALNHWYQVLQYSYQRWRELSAMERSECTLGDMTMSV